MPLVPHANSLLHPLKFLLVYAFVLVCGKAFVRIVWFAAFAPS